MRRDSGFETIRTEGSLLPSDILQRIAEGDSDLKGLKAQDYHITGEKLNEAISRSWNTLTVIWSHFRKQVENLQEGQPTTGFTREKWLLPLFKHLDYGRLQPSKATQIDDKSYPISHFWHKSPIHLVGMDVDLNKRTPGQAGAARQSPHSMVQEFLNRSEDHLWGFLSNGYKLRILRDNISMTRQAYVEFDLESMMEGEAYSDFVVLWLLCHQSRVENERPELCWLETWTRTAQEEGTRALDSLRIGVEEAIRSLGKGFLANTSNTLLREELRNGTLDKQDYYRQLLRIVYRFLFLFVSEARDLLLIQEKENEEARARYNKYYSITRLRHLADKRRGGKHPDLWRSLKLIFRSLNEEGCKELALPALGSFLWSKQATENLNNSDISNRYLLDAIRALSQVKENSGFRRTDFRNLGTEELGSIYESLLELHPHINSEAATFELEVASGHERKTTGSYYTPTSLINELLNSALEPVIDQTIRNADNPEEAILNLKVCDPASGSGHFLIAAAHRIAKRLAAIRTGEEEPAPEPYKTALRDVIGHCIYGVDINPMSVELCKVSLWLEALEPGKPLNFLDHHIKCGNSLLGTTPELIDKGIPDDAFKPIIGDDKKIASQLRKKNKAERTGGQMTLGFDSVESSDDKYRQMGYRIAEVDDLIDTSLQNIKAKEIKYSVIKKSDEFKQSKLLADAWCAAFVWRKTPDLIPPVTTDTIRKLEKDSNLIPIETREEVNKLADQYNFFHWHLEYPEVFYRDKEKNGFDVVLGNPPWEHTELKEKEYFASRNPEIANSPGATRKKLINQLQYTDPALFQAFSNDKREHDVSSHFVRTSGKYPFCGRGRINTYAIFAELNRNLLNSTGRIGCIVPSGIATDDTTKFFFQDLVEKQSLISFYEFENEGFFKGPGAGHMVRFALVTMTRGTCEFVAETEYLFQGKVIEDLKDDLKLFALSREDIELINPNTKTCPIFRSKRDAEITKDIYRRVPVLINENDPGNGNPWGITFKQGLFNMTSDSHLFKTREQLESEGWTLNGNVFFKNSARYLPLYEGKMIHIYNHRYGDFAYGKSDKRSHILPEVPIERVHDPYYVVQPYKWVPKEEVLRCLDKFPNRQWFLGFRNVSDSRASSRTMISSVVPYSGIGNSMPLLFDNTTPDQISCLYANLASYIFDYYARQKVSGLNLNFFFVKQFPILPPDTYSKQCLWALEQTLISWISERVLELVYTSWDIQPFAEDMGHSGPPFKWDEERRFQLRCELNAAFFHLYGIDRDDINYIMETFPIVKKIDEKEFGDYRTKKLILEIYDKMQHAIETGNSYQTILDPPPADPSVAHSTAMKEKF